MRESVLLILVVAAMTAYTIHPMLEGPQPEAATDGRAADSTPSAPSPASTPAAATRVGATSIRAHEAPAPAGQSAADPSLAPPSLDGRAPLASRLAAYLPMHQRLRDEAAAGQRPKW